MRARVVIGANFGDEGKGLVTDYLCRQGAEMVVRFNGGAQAGHTVIDPSGKQHVFGHFGSGTFVGVPTYLSEYFIVNPILFEKELGELNFNGIAPVTYAHPSCLVTTFADMWINQKEESNRGDKRHGSVGVGINETINRSRLSELKITMGDLWNNPQKLESKLVEICGKYAKFRVGEEIKYAGNMITAFLKGCENFADQIHPLGIQQCKDPVFEVAQGLLLDQDNKEFFPHVTRSHTGIKNARELCTKIGISTIDAYYVTRTYLTRHGAGPLPGHDPTMTFVDETNVPHPFQGTMRFGPLDDGVFERCVMDYGSDKINLVATHVDQLQRPVKGMTHISVGPTAADVMAEKR